MGDITISADTIKIGDGGYGSTYHIEAEGDVIVTPDSLSALAQARRNEFPDANDPDRGITAGPSTLTVSINGANNLTFTPEAAALLNPDFSRSNGEAFNFGGAEGVRFDLNNIGGQPGVENLIVGNRRIDFGDRMREFNQENYETRREILRGVVQGIEDEVKEAVDHAKSVAPAPEPPAPQGPSPDAGPTLKMA